MCVCVCVYACNPSQRGAPVSEMRRDAVGGVRERRGRGVGEVGQLVLGHEEAAQLHHHRLGVVVLVVHDRGLPDAHLLGGEKEENRVIFIETGEHAERVETGRKRASVCPPPPS